MNWIQEANYNAALEKSGPELLKALEAIAKLRSTRGTICIQIATEALNTFKGVHDAIQKSQA